MNDSEKAISKYLKDVKHLLPYTCKTRKMLLTELRESIEELNTAKDTLTYETLVAEIGSPEEVAHSFEDRESIAASLKRSRRYSKAKVILACVAALLICAVIITVVVVTNNDSYYSQITTNQTDLP